MTNDVQLLRNKRPVNKEIKVASQKGAMIAEQIGKVEMKHCELENVLYIPELRGNLMSVSAIDKQGGKVEFYNGQVKICKNERVIFRGKRNDGGLYAVKEITDEGSVLMTTKHNSVRLWHYRLGHLSPRNMMKLLNISEGIKLTKEEIFQELQSCNRCLKANLKRLPFDNQRSRASQPLEIIHTDICGPIFLL
ncbi:Copia protein [Dufourea novaeangliae]|uniref:Copia protein n=1 Tax=Dufourea novaeangliae TaxID=178035 RepID=A0A154P6K6_DUFNO|nr:Copia protein [Dufourea novaeangliae]